MSWNDLSMADRARYIQLGVQNGITDLNNIKNIYNSYAEGGSIEKYGIFYIPSEKVWRNKENKVIGGGFRTTLSNGRTVHFNTDGTVTDMNSPVLLDIKRRLRETENNKNNPNGGWDAINEVWRPHGSREGGEKTIAYGLKLQENTPNPVKKRWVNIVKNKGYLTDTEAEEMLSDLALSYMNEAKKSYNRRTKDKGSWDELSPKSQSILTDFQYNPGLYSFKNLINGFDTEDMEKINNQYKRYLTIGKGKKKRKLELTERNKAIKTDIDSIALGFYPIKRQKL